MLGGNNSVMIICLCYTLWVQEVWASEVGTKLKEKVMYLGRIRQAMELKLMLHCITALKIFYFFLFLNFFYMVCTDSELRRIT